MKKFLLVLFGIIAVFGFDKVSAAEIKLEYDTNINEVESAITEIGADNVKEKINDLISLYGTEYSTEYPYYFISLVNDDLNNSFIINLIAFSEPGDKFHQTFANNSKESYYHVPVNDSFIQIRYNYNFSDNTFSYAETVGVRSIYPLIYVSADEQQFNPYTYYYSNFDLYYRGSSFAEEIDSFTFFKSEDTFYFPTFSDPLIYNKHKVNSEFRIDPYYLHDNNEYIDDEKYITIDLNQYSYVIASLKDYSPRDTFTTTMYVKGQLCATPVYNYGTEEKKDYVSGWQTPDCGTYFNDYTRHLNFIREDEIKNHAVYYYSALDFSKPNLVKIDSSVYDVTYITSENENNPLISVNGNNYQSLPYSGLTDSAILTEKNGISNTWTCAKYDTDCFLDSSGINIDGLFSNPLETLKSIWDSIVSIFEIITEFIELLPPVMQGFLYLAFGVGIALGIIKIIL